MLTTWASFGIRILLSHGPVPDVRYIPRLLIRHKCLPSCRLEHVLLPFSLLLSYLSHTHIN